MFANYTVTLKTLMDNPQTKPLLDKALSTYPMYLPRLTEREYMPNIIPSREELNRKLLNHFKYREIGFETVGRFLDELEIAMCEIMPYYNQLMFTQDQDYNIIYNVDYKRTTTTDRAGESASTSKSTEDVTLTKNSKTDSTGKITTDVHASDNSTSDVEMDSKDKNVQSATPQGQLDIPANEIDSVSYADEAKWGANESKSITYTDGESESNTVQDSTGSDTTTGTTKTEGANNVTASGSNTENENVLETTKGNFGVVSAQDLVAKYRAIIINIEQMIIEDKRIQELFMLVY